MIQTRAYPRAAVIGNPSDGYHGKTIAFVFSNFQVDLKLEASDYLEIDADHGAAIKFNNVNDLISSIEKNGYTEKLSDHQLVIAAIKVLSNKLEGNCLPTFKIQYSSNIPRSVGLAGSSAIITATIRALLQLNQIVFPKPRLANLILSVEREELGIEAGLQDRVAQVYETPITMDFDAAIMDIKGYGNYHPIEGLEKLNFYIAYPTNISENSNVVHSNLRSRYDDGDLQVTIAMQAFAGITNSFVESLTNGTVDTLNKLINQNFDLRKSIIKVHPAFDLMIRLARTTGVSAKFTGSGGAFIGIYKDAEQFDELKSIMAEHNIKVLRPKIVFKNEN